jgi:hypothetical protein
MSQEIYDGNCAQTTPLEISCGPEQQPVAPGGITKRIKVEPDHQYAGSSLQRAVQVTNAESGPSGVLSIQYTVAVYWPGTLSHKTGLKR